MIETDVVTRETRREGGDRVSLADALVSLLHDFGVRVIFGVGGTHTLSLLGALERDGRVAFVSARTEVGAVNMAIGYARSTERPGVLLTSTGPGAFNALSGLCDARWSALPILHVTTYVDGPSFAGDVHETPGQEQIFGIPSKISARVSAFADLEVTVIDLWRACTKAPHGPVTLEVAASAWALEGVLQPSMTRDPVDVTATAPTPDVTRVLDALEAALRPLLFVGGGAVRDEGSAAVRALADHLGAPIISSWQGKSVATWDHSLYLGPWGAERSVHELAAGADVALVIGTKLSQWPTGRWRLPLPQNSFWIDASPQAPHPHYPQLHPVRGEAVPSVSALLAQTEPKSPWAHAAVADVRDSIRESVSLRSAAEWSFVEAFGTALGADGLLSLDMTKPAFWLMKYLRSGTRGIHNMSSYMAMGSAIPAAIGLFYGREQPVVAVVGDGGLQMSVSELGTIAELQCPVTTVVFVDGVYGLLRDNGLRATPPGSANLGVQIVNPDFGLLARAYDMPAVTCRSPEDLRRALWKPSDRARMIIVPFSFSRGW